MNERIAQLIQQATMIEDHYPAGCNGYPEQRVWFDKDKFAELIIRECARAVDRVYETSEPDHGCYDWATWAYGSDVLAHFELDKPA